MRTDLCPPLSLYNRDQTADSSLQNSHMVIKLRLIKYDNLYINDIMEVSIISLLFL